MDTNMEDVGRVPTDVAPVHTEPATRSTLEQWIENLMNCKQLSEADVQRLCDMVSIRRCERNTDARRERLPLPDFFSWALSAPDSSALCGVVFSGWAELVTLTFSGVCRLGSRSRPG